MTAFAAVSEAFLSHLSKLPTLVLALLLQRLDDCRQCSQRVVSAACVRIAGILLGYVSVILIDALSKQFLLRRPRRPRASRGAPAYTLLQYG